MRGVDVDVGEEVFVHECVVGFGVLARDADVFVLADCNVSFVLNFCKIGGRGTMLKVTTFSKEISPALYFSTRIL